MSATFLISIDGGAALTVEDIWPDGDAPADPSVEDVVARIKARWRHASDFLRDWNLDPDVEVVVSERDGRNNGAVRAL